MPSSTRRKEGRKKKKTKRNQKQGEVSEREREREKKEGKTRVDQIVVPFAKRDVLKVQVHLFVAK